VRPSQSDVKAATLTKRDASHGSVTRPETRSVIATHPRSRRSYQYVTKRVFDIITATSGLIIFSPIFLFVSLAIRLDSPGPVLCTRIRRSYSKRTTRILYFRSTASIGADEKNLCLTRLGRLLHQTGVDQLPMLLNVLRVRLKT